jgi:hypothetical protein
VNWLQPLRFMGSRAEPMFLASAGMDVLIANMRGLKAVSAENV